MHPQHLLPFKSATKNIQFSVLIALKGAKILNVGKRGEGIGCETDIHIAGKSENVIIEAVNICDSSDFGAGVWIEHVEHTIIKECYFENNPNIDIKIGSEKNASDSYTN